MKKLYKTSAIALCMMIASSAMATVSAAQLGTEDIAKLCGQSTACNGNTTIQTILAGCTDGSCDLQSLIDKGCCSYEDITNLINCNNGNCGILIDNKQCITTDGECSQTDVETQKNTPSDNTGNTQTPTSSDNTGNTQTPTPSDTTNVSAYEREVAELVNSYRAQYGLSPLTLSTELSDVARAKSQDMHDKKYFSHTSPTYGSPFDMMRSFGITYRTAGENIAMGQQTPKAVVEAWMNSEGHRANILNANFTQIGVGYVQQGNYWTQMFIG